MQLSDYPFPIIYRTMSIACLIKQTSKSVAYIFMYAGLLCCCLSTLAQERIEGVWHTGGIVLTDDDTIECQFSVTLSTEIVQAKQGDKIATFSARQIHYLYFQDTEELKTRYLFSLPFSNTLGGYKVPKFFELVVEGECASLFTRESIINDFQMQISPYNGAMMTIPIQRLGFEYYIRKQNGTVFQVKTRKRDMLLILQDQEEAMKTFLEANSINYRDRADLVKILDYYNSLCSAQQNKTKQGH